MSDTLTLIADQATGAGSFNGESVQLRFKGVVRHPNGHWGAQIYAGHRRVWIGTFKTEREAALAYDRAAFKLRSDDLNRNCNIHLDSQKLSLEADFQHGLSTEDVLSMIKDGSYESHLAEFERKLCDHNVTESSETTVATKLFEKVLTRSDVGKLNRLVIPKKSAVKFQERLMENRGQEDDNEMEIEFFDNEMNCWRFRFCYWKSSHSFVFTKGWNKFVRLKNLKENDVVVFNMCRRKGELKGKDAAFFTIDVQKSLSMHAMASRWMKNGVANDSESINSLENIESSNTLRLFGVDITLV